MVVSKLMICVTIELLCVMLKQWVSKGHSRLFIARVKSTCPHVSLVVTSMQLDQKLCALYRLSMQVHLQRLTSVILLSRCSSEGLPLLSKHGFVKECQEPAERQQQLCLQDTSADKWTMNTILTLKPLSRNPQDCLQDTAAQVVAMTAELNQLAEELLPDDSASDKHSKQQVKHDKSLRQQLLDSWDGKVTTIETNHQLFVPHGL